MAVPATQRPAEHPTLLESVLLVLTSKKIVVRRLPYCWRNIFYVCAMGQTHAHTRITASDLRAAIARARVPHSVVGGFARVDPWRLSVLLREQRPLSQEGGGLGCPEEFDCGHRNGLSPPIIRLFEDRSGSSSKRRPRNQ